MLRDPEAKLCREGCRVLAGGQPYATPAQSKPGLALRINAGCSPGGENHYAKRSPHAAMHMSRIAGFAEHHGALANEKRPYTVSEHGAPRGIPDGEKCRN